MKKRGKNQGKSKKKRNKRLILLLNMTKESVKTHLILDRQNIRERAVSVGDGDAT